MLLSPVHQELRLKLEVQQREAPGDLEESIFSGGHGLRSEEGVE